MNLLDLSPDLLTSILCEWCEGKTISTFLLTHTNALEYTKGALVARMDRWAQCVPQQDEILNVLALLRDEMETTTPTVRFYSELCAILDYLEGHSPSSGHYVCYVGRVDTSWGNLGVWVTTPTWSLNATHSFYYDHELHFFSLNRPHASLETPCYTPFGSLLGLTIMDSRYLDRVRQKLEGYPEVYKRMLTPSTCAFDDAPPLLFTTHSFAMEQGYDMRHGNKSLCCYWDNDEGLNDDAITHLADNVIRIMDRMVKSEENENDSRFWQVLQKKMSTVNQMEQEQYLDDSDDNDSNDDHDS